MRTLLIAGNWKLNPTTTEAAVTLAEGVKTGLGTATDVHVAVAPPFVFLSRIDEVLKNTPIGLAAQDMTWETSGAFTGEISGADARRRRLHPRDPGPQRAAARHGRDQRPGQQEAQGRARGQADSRSSASASSRKSGWPSRPRPCSWTSFPARWPG